MEACALREAGRQRVMKPEEFWCTVTLPQRGAQRGAVESQKSGQSRDLEVRKQRKLHFSAYEQLVDCDSDQMADSGTQEKTTEASGRGRAWRGGEIRGAWYTNLSSAHDPLGAEGRPR